LEATAPSPALRRLRNRLSRARKFAREAGRPFWFREEAERRTVAAREKAFGALADSLAECQGFTNDCDLCGCNLKYGRMPDPLDLEGVPGWFCAACRPVVIEALAGRRATA
jgi:hypothetical protein